MKERKDSRENYDFNKNSKHQSEQFAKDDLIDRPANQAKRYKISGEGIPAKGPKGEPPAPDQPEEELAKSKKEEMLREDTSRETNRRKDPRNTYEFDKDVRYKREHYAKDDLIDRPVNKAVRYEIKGRVEKKDSEEEE